MLDLFSGIGGFHEGFKRAGYQFDWVGFSEIDKYASAVYRYKYRESEELNDIKLIRPGKDTPDNIDVLCGGFPCQSFSMAGKRAIDDTRGTLFFEIARLLSFYRKKQRPIRCLVLENVKGLLNHDNGRTFATIYRVLADLGYTVECQLLNTRWVLPQNRERIYIIGHLGNGSRSKVFPIGQGDSILQKSRGPGQTKDQCATAITQNIMRGAHSGGETLIQVGTLGRKQDSYDFNSRVYSDQGIAKTLAGEGGNNDNKTGLYKLDNKVRRLTPKECERLQGFPDDWTAYADGHKISDTQRYKMCGNAVSVPVVELVAKKIRSLHG